MGNANKSFRGDGRKITSQGGDVSKGLKPLIITQAKMRVLRKRYSFFDLAIIFDVNEGFLKRLCYDDNLYNLTSRVRSDEIYKKYYKSVVSKIDSVVFDKKTIRWDIDN